MRYEQCLSSITSRTFACSISLRNQIILSRGNNPAKSRIMTSFKKASMRDRCNSGHLYVPSLNLSTVMSAVPDLPFELHAEILRNLHHYRDRPTLLSTALVNKEWSKESQRILFSKMTDHWYGNTERRENVVFPRHRKFLRTVAEHPRRLGPLVRSYAQHALAYNLEASKSKDFDGQCTHLTQYQRNF